MLRDPFHDASSTEFPFAHPPEEELAFAISPKLRRDSLQDASSMEFSLLPALLGSGTKMKRPIIIGGGISGLSTAAWLDDAIVLESQESIGGWVQSKKHRFGFSVDLAANGWLDNEPTVAELIKHIHKTEELLPASAERKIRWIYHKNNLVALP